MCYQLTVTERILQSQRTGATGEDTSNVYPVQRVQDNREAQNSYCEVACKATGMTDVWHKGVQSAKDSGGCNIGFPNWNLLSPVRPLLLLNCMTQ
jgi:hypothetical protein